MFQNPHKRHQCFLSNIIHLSVKINSNLLKEMYFDHANLTIINKVLTKVGCDGWRTG